MKEHLDNAIEKWKELYALKLKLMGTYRELGRALYYERALKELGITREDVNHVIYGNQIGAIDNFKGTEVVRRCQRTQCTLFGRNQTTQNGCCASCEESLSELTVRITPVRLRVHYGRYIFGLAMNDGRHLFLKEPIAPIE